MLGSLALAAATPECKFNVASWNTSWLADLEQSNSFYFDIMNVKSYIRLLQLISK